MSWKRFVAAAAGLITAALLAFQIYVSHDEWASGREAPGWVTLISYPALDPNVHLSLESKDVAVSYTVNGRRLDNLLISDNSLRNSGRSRIEPDDFDRPVSVKVSSPWEIVTIENSPFPSMEPRL